MGEQPRVCSSALKKLLILQYKFVTTVCYINNETDHTLQSAALHSSDGFGGYEPEIVLMLVAE